MSSLSSIVPGNGKRRTIIPVRCPSPLTLSLAIALHHSLTIYTTLFRKRNPQTVNFYLHSCVKKTIHPNIETSYMCKANLTVGVNICLHSQGRLVQAGQKRQKKESASSMQTLFDYWLFLPDALAPNALAVDSQQGRDPSEICEYDVFHGVPSARLLNL